MKKIYILSFALLITSFSFAKKVKFSVDMTGQILSPNGIHVSGDFQDEAGFPADWDSGTTPLAQEGTTNIYSTIVDIPAFTKYEYKFVNGDQFYEVEFVPVESRVGYNFNDNRWIYIDSLANDITDIGAVLFAGNAPIGKKLIRFYVDLQGLTISSKGVHVAGTFQGSNPATTYMYNLEGTAKLHEVIAYVDSTTTYQYKFYNGNTSGDTESVPVSCANSNGYRTIQATKDTLLPIVCFSSCSACVGTFVTETAEINKTIVYPNPTNNFSEILFDDNSQKQIIISDIAGKTVQSKTINDRRALISKENLEAGIYFIQIQQLNKRETIKWIIK